MPITHQEAWRGGSLSKKTAKLRWIISGAANAFEAEAYMRLNAPTSVADLVINDWDIERISRRHYQIEMSYATTEQNDKEEQQKDQPKQPTEPGDSEYSWDISTENTTRFEAISQASYPEAHRPGVPFFGKTIGVKDGQAEGVDVPVPVMVFSETAIRDGEDDILPYLKTLRDLTGRTNAEPFRGFEAGEVLFMGSQGSKTGKGHWRITYHFHVGENRTDLSFGTPDPFAADAVISVPEKGAWDYLWIWYKPVADSTGGALLAKPGLVHVAKVIESADFALLEI